MPSSLRLGRLSRNTHSREDGFRHTSRLVVDSVGAEDMEAQRNISSFQGDYPTIENCMEFNIRICIEGGLSFLVGGWRERWFEHGARWLWYRDYQWRCVVLSERTGMGLVLWHDLPREEVDGSTAKQKKEVCVRGVAYAPALHEREFDKVEQRKGYEYLFHTAFQDGGGW